jgi:predicted dehydrogenase
MTHNRRDFLRNSSALVVGLGMSSIVSNEALADVPAESTSSRVNLGVIGVGMGCRDLQGALTGNPWVHCIALCDVNSIRLEEQAARFKKEFPLQASNIRMYSDFRKLLENKDIDGVIIATPDHWHTYIFAEAIKAGKAVYVEKPVANSIEECHILMDLQKKHKKVVTTGLWQTSQKYFVGANEILKSGVLGEVYKVQIWLSQSTDPKPRVEDSPAPSTIDYEMWLGPAPERPFNTYRNRSWRSFWDYGGGQQTDWGVHWIDSAMDGLQALGLCKREFPLAVFSTAYKNKDSFNETPGCQTTIFQYENFHIEWAQQVAYLYNRNQGVAWIGSKATLVCNRDGYELIPQLDKNNQTSVEAVKVVGKFEEGGIEAHTTNWCNCIRENSLQTNSPIEKGAFATVLAHMANISYRTGTKVVYNPDKRRFVDNPDADFYIKPHYRLPWVLPGIDL